MITQNHKLGIEMEFVGEYKKVVKDLKDFGIDGIEAISIYQNETVKNTHASWLGLKFVIKPETNRVKGSCNAAPITELAFDPVEFNGNDLYNVAGNKISNMQRIADYLRGRGYGGTKEGLVSNQVNYDVSELKPAQVLCIAASRDAYKIKHLGRREFIQPFTQRFNYYAIDAWKNPNITVDEVFYNYFYGQIKDILNSNLTDDDIVDIYTNPDGFRAMSTVMRIVKYQNIKLASWLIHSCPKAAVSKAIEEYGVIWPIPAIEFREFNQTFNIFQDVEDVIIHVEFALRRYGYLTAKEIAPVRMDEE